MHDGTWARGVHWFLTRPGVDGGKGCLDRARGVVAVLRAMPAPLHATDEAFLFTTPTGRPVDDSSRSTGTARSARLASVRGTFYATRDSRVADLRLRLGSEAEASVWRSVDRAKAMPGRQSRPGTTWHARGPGALRLRAPRTRRRQSRTHAPESLPRRLTALAPPET